MWIPAIVVTFLLSWMFILPVEKLAWKIGAIDVPKDWRRMHCRSIPRAGGIAVFAAILIGYLIFCRHRSLFSAAVGGGLLIMAIGLVDDVYHLPAWIKFLFQLFVSVLTVVTGGVVSGAALPLAVLWVVGLTNAHNFVDGLDGLFGGTATVEGIALSILLMSIGLRELALFPLLISAACCGFLLYNRPPARIFAGDCGSGSVGFLLGMLSLPAFTHSQWSLGILAPFLIFAYPLTDLITAVLRRVLHGYSPFAADRAHLHHRICAVGISQPACTAILLLLSAALGTVGVLVGNDHRLIPAVTVIAGTILLMAGIRRFLIRFAQNN